MARRSECQPSYMYFILDFLTYRTHHHQDIEHSSALDLSTVKPVSSVNMAKKNTQQTFLMVEIQFPKQQRETVFLAFQHQIPSNNFFKLRLG